MNGTDTPATGLTAATTAVRALLAAGWIYDSTSPMADYTTIRTLLHPSGREIHARTVDRDDDDTTSLTMTGLSLEQVAGAITGAGLAPTEPEQPQPEPDLRQRFAAELHRIADDIVTQQLPLGAYMTMGFGVLSSRADLERWAAHFGSAIQVEGSNGIPWTESTVRLDDTGYGPELRMQAQIQPEGPSELERLRADNARLQAQLAEGVTR